MYMCEQTTHELRKVVRRRELLHTAMVLAAVVLGTLVAAYAIIHWRVLP